MHGQRLFLLLTCASTARSLLIPHPVFNLTSLQPDCSCPLSVEPVCGVRGKTEYTYVNECILKCSEQSARLPIRLLYQGACCRTPTCTQFDPPVCDMNGEMYSNACELEAAQCIAVRLHATHIGLDTQAPKCQCVRPCGRDWDPVCDTNGKTHANLCTFLNYRCFHKMQLKENIEIDYMGTCCEDICQPSAYSQVFCDSAGSTHRDLCSFHRAKCRAQRRSNGEAAITIEKMGPCVAPEKARRRMLPLERLFRSILLVNYL